jgi:hypothetical protein
MKGILCMVSDRTLTANDGPAKAVDALDCRGALVANGTG